MRKMTEVLVVLVEKRRGDAAVLYRCYLTSHLHKDIGPRPFHLGCKGLPAVWARDISVESPAMNWVKEGCLSYFAFY
jgi:hypothetical protein